MSLPNINKYDDPDLKTAHQGTRDIMKFSGWILPPSGDRGNPHSPFYGKINRTNGLVHPVCAL
jgi:hypothetical protein